MTVMAVQFTTLPQHTFLHPRYCNLAANLVLKWPNDGIAELDQSTLPGAVHVENFDGSARSFGHEPICTAQHTAAFAGECHSTGMKWPAQVGCAPVLCCVLSSCVRACRRRTRAATRR